MGIVDKIFSGKRADGSRPAAGFKTVTEYQPTFFPWNSDMYEQQLVRAVIERIAMACSKLEPCVIGPARPRVARAFETSPNQYMTWPRFLARCATVLYNDTSLFVVPAYKPGTDVVTGVYPLVPESAELVEYAGEAWYRFQLGEGDVVAMEAKEVCLLTRFQYKSDFFGSGNRLDSTLRLMDAQSQAQDTAMRNSAAIRFVARANGTVREEDLKEKAERFSEDYLMAANNKTGLATYDATFDDLKQVEPYNWTIPDKEMRRIREDVFFYFGMNEAILTNDYDEGQWGAFYEGVIEPFAIQLGEGLSQMLYTMRERPRNRVEFSANRLQYSSNATKRNMGSDMLDRGVFTVNQVLEMLQMPPVPDGDVRILRGEYKVGHTIDEILAAQRAQAAAGGGGRDWADIDRDPQDADLLRADSEGYGSDHGDDFDTGTGGRRAD